MKKYSPLYLPFLLINSHNSYFVKLKPFYLFASLRVPFVERRSNLKNYFSTLAPQELVKNKKNIASSSNRLPRLTTVHSIWQEKNEIFPLYLGFRKYSPLQGKKKIESTNTEKRSKIIKGILGQGHNNVFN